MKLSALRGMGLALILLAVACAPPRPSVDVQFSRPIPAAVFIENTAVLDVERGTLQQGRDVLLEGGRIREITPTGRAGPPEGALVIPGDGATLVPGLIDMHGHVTGDAAPTWERSLADLSEANLRGYLYAGVTTVFDPGDGSGEAYARRDRVASGGLIGPRIVTAGPLLTAVEGHPIALVRALAPGWIAWYIAPRVARAIGSEADAIRVVDELAAQDTDAIKVVVDSIPLDAPRLTPALIRAVVDRANHHGLRVVAHIGTTQDAIDAAEAGVSAWVHGVYKERIPEDQIARLASYGIPMVTTIEVFDSYGRAGKGERAATRLEREIAPPALLDAFYPRPDDFDIAPLQSWLDLAGQTFEVRVENTRRLRAAGVTILAGSDAQSGVFFGAGLHRELHHLVRAGMTPAEAIRAATLDAARFLANGEEPNFGSIEVGKQADLLLVDGDPTRDVGALENIRHVFLGGIPLERTPVSNAAAPE